MNAFDGGFLTALVGAAAAFLDGHAALTFAMRLTLLAGTGLLALRLLDRAPAALRHRVSVATLVAALLLPVAQFGLPAWIWPVLPASSVTPLAAPIVWPSPGPRGVPVSAPGKAVAGISQPAALDDGTGRGIGADLARLKESSSRLQPTPFGSTFLLLAVALAGALVGLVRLVRDHWSAAKLCAGARPISDDAVRGDFRRALERIGVNRDVRLLESDRLGVPVVCGTMRPALILPSAAAAWSRPRRRRVLLHELAHVQRGDIRAVMLARVVRALYWFHPLIAMLERRAALACEQACDDAVLAAGGRASNYARDLLVLARRARSGEGAPAIAPAFARVTTLERRLAAILNPAARRGRVSRGGAAVVGFGALAALVLLGTVRVVAAPTCAPESAPAPAGHVVTVGHDSNGLSDAAEAAYDRATELYGAERYAEAAPLYLDAARGGHGGSTALYNAGCCLALAGKPGAALDALEQALAAGFAEFALLATDADLDAVRSEPRFVELQAKAAATDSGRARRLKALVRFRELRDGGTVWDGAWNELGIELMGLLEFQVAVDAFQREHARNGSTTALYNQACAWSRAGRTEFALAALEQAILEGFDSVDKIRDDGDLVALRALPRFRELLNLATDLKLDFQHSERSVDEWRARVPHHEAIARARPAVGRAWFNAGFAQLAARLPEASAVSFRHCLELGYRPDLCEYNLACASALQNRPDEALESLHRARGHGLEVGARIASDPDLESLRSDPRFRELLDTWQKNGDGLRSDRIVRKEERKQVEKIRTVEEKRKRKEK